VCIWDGSPICPEDEREAAWLLPEEAAALTQAFAEGTVISYALLDEAQPALRPPAC
jgi:hypothetical protein